MKSVLFISHDASRTGAPIVLLHFLSWLRKNTNIPFVILLQFRGELESSFSQLAPTFIYEIPIENRLFFENCLSRRINNWLGCNPQRLRDLALKKWLHKYNVGLIYSNTIANAAILHSLTYLRCPILTHIHELNFAIHCVGIENLHISNKLSSYYIACSKAVEDNLITNHKISEKIIKVVHEFIPVSPSEHLFCVDHKDKIKDELGLPKSSLVVGSSGATVWRKGADLFIQLARIVHSKVVDLPVYFVWVGGQKEGLNFMELQHDIHCCGLKEYVHFLGTKINPLEYFSIFDVFVLTSREDPFPLVCLEAASLGKPIVCFDKAGGECEFVETDCGFVVPYLALDIMADKVIKLLESSALRNQLGAKAAHKVRERHDVNYAAPRILEAMTQLLNQK